MAVGASVIAYAASLIVQWAVLRTRLGTRISVEPMIQLGPWLGRQGAGECLLTMFVVRRLEIYPSLPVEL